MRGNKGKAGQDGVPGAHHGRTDLIFWASKCAGAGRTCCCRLGIATTRHPSSVMLQAQTVRRSLQDMCRGIERGGLAPVIVAFCGVFLDRGLSSNMCML